ncbi:MAG: hypothetical protein V4733_12030 [Verrucomicrobiota bacterium]
MACDSEVGWSGFGISSFAGEMRIGIDLAMVANKEQVITGFAISFGIPTLHAGTATGAICSRPVDYESKRDNQCNSEQYSENPNKKFDAQKTVDNHSRKRSKHHDKADPENAVPQHCKLRCSNLSVYIKGVVLIREGLDLHLGGNSSPNA